MKKITQGGKITTKKSKKKLQSPNKTILKRQSSIKQLKLQNLENKPKTLMIVYYKEKRLSIPVYTKCQNSMSFIIKNLIRFQQEVFGNKNIQKIKNIVSFKTKQNDILKDYYIYTGKDVSIFKIVQVEPMWKTIQPKNGLANYQIYRCIGQGGFSKVYLARMKTNGNFYALKVINKQNIKDNKIQMVRTQDHILKILDYPFLVKMDHSFETPRYIVFVLQYCPGGELFYHLRKLKRLSQNQARIYFVQMLLAFQYLHQHKILYRDIKPQNIMMDAQGHLKLSDFGLSKIGLSKGQKTHSFCGSNQYMAPQMISEQGHDYLLDYYCLGALLYQFVIGYPPFYCHDKQQIFESIRNKEVQFPQKIELSEQIKWLLKDLLKKNPKQRLGSVGGIRQILAHPWLKKINVKSILNKQIQSPIKPNILLYNIEEEHIDENLDEVQKLKTEQQISSQFLERNYKIEKNGESEDYIMKPIIKGNSKSKSKNVRKEKSKQQIKRSKSKKKINVSVQKKKKQIVVQNTKKQNLKRIKSADNLRKTSSKKLIKYK